MFRNIFGIILLLLTSSSFASDSDIEDEDGFTLIYSTSEKKKDFDHNPLYFSFIGLSPYSPIPVIKNSQEKDKSILKIESKEEVLETSLRKEESTQQLSVISTPNLFTLFEKSESEVTFKIFKLYEFLKKNSDLPEIMALYFRASDEQRKIIDDTADKKQPFWKAKVDRGTEEVDKLSGNLYSKNQILHFLYSSSKESSGNIHKIQDDIEYIISFRDENEKCIKNILLSGKEFLTHLNAKEDFKRSNNFTRYRNIYIQPAND